MAELHTNADILDYLSSEGYQNSTITEKNPTVIAYITTETELTNTQKCYIKNNLPIYVHCEFCVG